VVRAPTVAKAAAVAARFPGQARIELELGDYAGLTDASFGAAVLTRAVARDAASAQMLLGIDASFEVCVELNKDTAAWLLGLERISERLALRQPSYERLTEAAARDVDLPSFFARFPHPVPVDDVPACILGRPPRPARRVLDTAMMTPEGRLEIFRYARRYIVDGYRTKSLRCAECTETSSCRGMHINYVRAHGYAAMRPIERTD
jgi:hypothetical protein